MIAGLEMPTSGSILSNSRDITSLPARSRNMGMVFQNYALFPHLDVFENIAFGLKTRRADNSTIKKRVEKALASVRMSGYERRAMHELSGGQQQRIALARALAIEPEVLLLDEPLSNLDPSLREDLRDEIRSVIRELGVTTVFVTHDQQEAFALADRIAVMNAGICRQVGRPEEVYNYPADPFVARFLGKANLLPAKCISRSAGRSLLEIAEGVRFQWDGKMPDGVNDLLVFVRSENVVFAEAVSRADEAAQHSVVMPGPATITTATFEGAIVNYTLDLNGVALNARHFFRGKPLLKPGHGAQIEFQNLHIMAAQ
jgi:iron(III) transport system ATP-binding protein